jgi:gliding motility-associated-like protein
MRNNLFLLFFGLLAFSNGWSQCGLCEKSVDLVTNGQFSQGNSGFSSDLEYVTGIFTCPLCPENTYTIGANAVFYHSGFTGQDHTNPPTGQFFIANGTGALASYVWCQNVAVQPQTNYTFSFWARDVTNNSNPHPMAQLYASFNGVWSADSLIAQGGWTQFTTSWFSGLETNLELCIINNQWQSGGNDFGLDDIALTACETIVLSQTAFAGSDMSICSNEAVSIGQPTLSGYNYTWIPTTGLDNPSSGQPTFSLQNDSDVNEMIELVLLRDSANVGCLTSDTIHIEVRHMPIWNALVDTVICHYDSVFFEIENSWLNPTWNNNLVTYNTWLGTGLHSLSLDYNGCTILDTLQILPVPLPDLELEEMYPACAPNGVLLELAESVQWSDGSLGTTWLTFDSDSISFVYEQDGCVFMDTTSIVIYQDPQWVLPSDTVACDGATLQLDPQIVGYWQWAEHPPVLQVFEEGNYVFMANNGPCDFPHSIEVIVFDTPALGEDALLDFCWDQPLVLEVAPDDRIEYTWPDSSHAASYQVTGPGMVTLLAENGCGIDSLDFEIVETVCSSALFIPNAFTPNEDGRNEGWRPIGHDLRTYHVIIYDQLGQAIFETRDPYLAWYPGTGRIDNAYSYWIEFTNFQGAHQIETGHILVLR